MSVRGQCRHNSEPTDMSGTIPTAPGGQHQASAERLCISGAVPLQRSRGPNCLRKVLPLVLPSGTYGELLLQPAWCTHPDARGGGHRLGEALLIKRAHGSTRHTGTPLLSDLVYPLA